MIQTTSLLSFRTQENQNLWAPGAAIELGIDTGDLLIFDPEEVTYQVDIGGSFLGFEGELFFDTKFGLLAYAEIGEVGFFNGGIDIALNAQHDAVVADNGVPIRFDFSDYQITSANLSSTGFGLGAEAGLDLVVGAELGFRNIEAALFGFGVEAEEFRIIDVPEKRIPIFTVSPFDTELPFDLGLGLELTLRVPTGADTEGTSTGSTQVSANGVSDTPFLELSADVDELILGLLGKVPFPPLAAVVKTLENSVFATFEFDISDYVPVIGEDIFTVEATVVDINASIGTAISEDLSLDFGNGDPFGSDPDINIALVSDNGTPLDLTDDIAVNAKLGDELVEIAGPTYSGFGTVTVDATFDVNRARFDHSFGIDITGSFNIDILQAETGGVIGSKLGINIGPLLSFEFPEGGFRANLFDDLFPNSFDVDGSAFNTQTESYEIFYSEVLPVGVDVNKPGQVQELIAFNEARQINLAASAAAFADVIDGRIAAEFTADVADNRVGVPEFATWALDRLIATVDLDRNLPVDERDILIIDTENTTGFPVGTPVPLGFLEARYDLSGNSNSFPTTGFINADNVHTSAGAIFLENLPKQSEIVDGFIFDTELTYRYNNGVFTELGDPGSGLGIIGFELRAQNSPNILGNDLDDLLVYFGDEARLLDGGAEEANSETGDVLVANFQESHPLDIIEWDLRTTAVGQSGDNISLQLTRGDAVRNFDASQLIAPSGFTLNGGTLDYSGDGTTPGIVRTSILGLDGTFVLRVRVEDTADGASEFTVTIRDGVGNFLRNVDEGSFTTNDVDPGQPGSFREVVVKNIDLNPGERIQIAATPGGGENARIQNVRLHEQHDVTFRDVESFVIKTGFFDDYIATGAFRDQIQFGQGEDTLLLTADRFEESMDLGDDADIAIIELADSAQVGATGDVFDIVHGQTGADEAVIRNISDSGVRWSVRGPHPVNFDATGEIITTGPTDFQSPSSSSSTNFESVFFTYGAMLEIWDQDSITSQSRPLPESSLGGFFIEAHTQDGGGEIGVRLSNFEAISFEGSDTANDVAFYFGGSFYDGGASNADLFVADFTRFDQPTGLERGIVLNGFHDGGDPNASSPFPDGPTLFRFDQGITYANGERIRTSTIDGFERFEVTATEFNDVLVGGAFVDTLRGEGGNDLLVGGGSDQSVVAGANRLEGGAGDDTFHTDGDEQTVVIGDIEFNDPVSGNDLLIFGAGDLADVFGTSLDGIGHEITRFVEGTGTVVTTYTTDDDAATLLTALDEINSAELTRRKVSFDLDDPTAGFAQFIQIEATNMSGLNNTSDLFLYDGGVTYIGGENDNDEDTFVADFSDQTFGITFVHDEAVNGTRLSNGVYLEGIDRVVLKLGSGGDFVTGGALDDYIEGGAGSDIFRGGGSVTQDQLFGGTGADLFAWNANDGVAIVDGGTDAGDVDGKIVDRVVVSARGADGSSLSNPGDGLGVRLFDATDSLLTDVDANSSDSDIITVATQDVFNSVRTEIHAGTGNFISFINVEATEVQGSNEEDDLILFQGGTFYDGGDRVGDRDVFVADLFGISQDISITARTGDDRVDDDEVFQDIGNGTTIGNFERLFLDLGAGDDFALGGDFNDRINGGGGNDILAGGLGDDTVDAGSGDDIIFYQGGIDLIRGGDDFDILEMGTIDGGYKSIAGGISENDLNGFVEIAALGSSIKVQDLVGQLLDSFETVSNFVRMQGAGGIDFASGAFQGTDEASYFSTDVEVVVVSADDDDDILISGIAGGTLSADGGDDVLISRNGEDMLIGGDGTDRYVFKDNWGDDIIAGEFSGTGELFFLGRDRADVEFLAFDFNDAATNDLGILDLTTGATVIFIDYFASGANGLDYTFTFDDQSSTLDLTGLGAQVTGAIPVGLTVFGTDLRDDLTQRTDGADSYFARAGNDLIQGSAGPDIISGGLGLDTVVYADSPVSGPGDLGVIVDLSFGLGFAGHADGDVLISIEDVLGSNGSDDISGDAKRNALAGGIGNDELRGRAGEDFLSGDSGDDRLFGGDDADLIFGGSGNDLAVGGDGDDFISTGAGNDSIEAGQGNDTVTGGDDDDIVLLDEGDDIYLIISSEASLNGVPGNDSVDGGIGNDLIELSQFDESVIIDLSAPQQLVTTGTETLARLSGFENAIGSNQNDILIGDAGANSLAGESGDDTLTGNEGIDLLIGGAGFDAVDYSLETGGGSIFVDLASDTFVDSFGNSETVIEVEHIIGANTYTVPGSAFDVLLGDDTDNRFTGNAGIDVDLINGRGGIDTVDYSAETGTQNYLADGVTPDGSGFGILVDLSAAGSLVFPNAFDTHGDADLLISIENVIGSIRDDEIIGNADNNLFVGGDGNDTLDGGDGIDVVDYSQESGGLNLAVFINDLAPETNLDTFGDTDILTDIEVIVGTDFSDTILRDAGSRHTLIGGGGNDSLQLVGTFNGIDGNSLFGGEGDDLLVGLGGSDIFFGGIGNDQAFGNSGSDVYVYTSGLDTFTGFSGTGFGSDEVNLTAMDSAILADLTTTQIFTSDTEDANDGPVRQIMEITGVDAISATDFSDSLTGNADDNRLYGGAGDDTFTGGDGSDIIEGGAGVDTWIVQDGGSGITLDLSLSGLNATDGFGNIESVSSIERVFGTAQADTFRGSASDETFVGGAGVDSFHGGDGIDTIDLSSEGGGGNTSVNLQFDSVTGETFGTLTDSFGNVENFRSIERFIGADGGFDDVFGGDGNEFFTGNAGSLTDQFLAGGGIDTADYSLEDGPNGVVADISVNGNLSATNATDTFGNADALADVENLIGSKNNDVFTGSAAANTLEGRDGDDVFFGNDGADLIDGGNGHDTVNYALETGGFGIVVDLRRVASQAQDTFGNFDTLRSIEQIFGTSFADDITGDDFGNALFGTHGNDFLDGWAGNDTLHGETDADTLFGWEGDDTLFGGVGNDFLNGEQEDDTLDGGAGADILRGGDGKDLASYKNSAAGVVVSLFTGSGTGGDAAGDILTEIEDLEGSALQDELTGDGNDNVLAGLAGSDTLDGGGGTDTADYQASTAGVSVNLATGAGAGGDAAGDVLISIENVVGSEQSDTITGDCQSNTLTGLDGNDQLNGGLGADTMDGGLGNDRFFVDDAGDVVIEAVGEGTDLLSTSVDFTLPDNVENGSTLGTGDAAITGNALANFITGNGGANVLRGEGGNDRLIAGLGDDTLEGGSGNDLLQGQGGADRFVVTANNGNDQILDWEATTDVLDFGALGLRFAELQITSSGNEALITFDDPAGGSGSIRLAGINPEALEIGIMADPGGVGSPGGIPLTAGTSGADNLAATNGDDDVVGLAGNDILNGRAGADTMVGGFGDDRYFLDNAGDLAVELQFQGTDQMDASFSFTLAEHVERGAVLGGGAVDITGNALGNFITGSALANVLRGEDGRDRLIGFDGDDTLIGGLDNDVLEGGLGADVFVFEADSGIDLITDFEVGIDLIDVTALGISFADMTIIDGALGARVIFDLVPGSVDLVTVQGVAAADLRLASFLGAPNDPIVGTAGNDVLFGTVEDDELQGLGGADLVDGRAGADTMIGGLGDDRYFVDDAGDVVTELPGEGTDQITTSVDVTLPDNVENGSASGSGDVALTGNALANALTGNAGANTLSGEDGSDNLQGLAGEDVIDGGAGTDVLRGGADADTFLFETGDGQGAGDQIIDFEIGVDTIDLSATGLSFANLSITDTGANATITYGSDTITVFNANAAQLSEDQFEFGP